MVEHDLALCAGATSASCVTTMIVVPCSCSWRNRSSTIFSFFSSRLPVGSSARISFGQLSERAGGCTRAAAHRRTAGRAGDAHAPSIPLVPALPSPASRRPRNGSIAPPSRSPPPSDEARGRTFGTLVLSCSCARRELAGVQILQSPAFKHDGTFDGVSMQPIMFISVVLPEPDEPTIASHCPCGTVRLSRLQRANHHKSWKYGQVQATCGRFP